MNNLWVIVDAGEEESNVLKGLQKTFINIRKENLQQFEKHNFEEYYPAHFQTKVAEVLSMPTKDADKTIEKEKVKAKRDAKAALLKEVEDWIDSNDADAKIELSEKAADVIKLLKNINLML